MAYVYSAQLVPPRARQIQGLGLFNDVNPEQSAKSYAKDYANSLKAEGKAAVDSSKQQAIEFAQAQLQSYPTAGAIEAQYERYAGYLKQIPNFNPADLQDPEKAVKLMQQALLIYARENGIPTNTKEAEQALEKYALQVASSELGIPLPDHLPTNATMLKQACVDLACTSVMMQTGVDPRLATVTVECLLDGKLSGQDCETIGACAGSIAGAQIAMSLGIPAPIGGFIGKLAGTMVGGTVAEILGLADPQDFVRELQRQEADLERAVLEQAQAICSSTRSMYWDAFDAQIFGTELQWRTLESKIGWKFQLRWFGQQVDTAPRSSPFIRSYVPGSQSYTGAINPATRASIKLKNINYDTYDDKGNLKVTPLWWCQFDFGCPYPSSGSIPGAGPLTRDAEAFLARGARWIPPGTGRPAECFFPIPHGTEAFDEAARCAWLARVKETVQSESAALASLQILSVAVNGDLLKTAASVAAEKYIYDYLHLTETQLNTAALKRKMDLSAAKQTGKQLTDLINYGMLIAGAGVLAAALYKKREESK